MAALMPVAASEAQSIGNGLSHSCALLASGAVKCWGDSSAGRTGYDTETDIGDGVGTAMAALPPVNLGAGHFAVALAAGDSHTCVILETGAVKCWGAGGSGRTGYDSTANIGDGVGTSMASLGTINLGAGRTAVAISAGAAHTCAILDNGKVKCWGNGGSGRTGYDTTANMGDGVGTPMASLPTVNLGAGRTALAISAGFSHTCAILDNGAVKCWGDSAQGRTGYDTTTDIGDGAGTPMASLSTVNLGSGRTALAISAGQQHTCAVLDNGKLKCWGDSAFGRTGYDTETDIGDGVGASMASLSTVNLGAGRTAVGVSGGNAYSCAILDTGAVKCWGYGGNGRTGYDSTATIGDGMGTSMSALTAVNLGAGQQALELAAGSSHTCVILSVAAVKCWGSSSSGQTGYDSTTNVGDGAGTSMASLGTVLLGAPPVAGQFFYDGFEAGDLTAWSSASP